MSRTRDSQAKTNADQATEVRDLRQKMRAALLKPQNKDQLIAQRWYRSMRPS